MNAPEIIQRPASTVEVFVGEVLPPSRVSQLMASLPNHVRPERFERNLVVAITQHPKLLKCNPAAVFNEVSKAAALGLYLDPQLGEAYLITGGGYGDVPLLPQLRLGYRGLSKLARQSGDLKGSPYAHEVCRNDRFEARLGTDKRLIHEPDYTQDRGDIYLYYAAVKFDDGETDFEVMSLEQIYRIRDRSDGWRAYVAKKIKSTPWSTDESEMAKKTVLRRLLKRLPQSPEIADALSIEDADYTEATEAPPRVSVASRLKSVSQGRPGFSIEHVEAVTADHFPITESEAAHSPAVEDGGEPSKCATAPPTETEAQSVEYVFEDSAEFASAASKYLEAVNSLDDLRDLWGQWQPDLRRLQKDAPADYARTVKAKNERRAELERAEAA